MLPLDGVKVVDLGTVLMAPYAGQWLADLGADVIKVELPAGDSSRRTGVGVHPNMAAAFLALNRNKRGIVLDLKTSEARDTLIELTEEADILLHNNRPHKMEALGLGPDVLLTRNPRLVYASLHGFGEDGPYGGRPAYDDIIQGMCGIADLAAQQAGTPRYLPTVVADKVAGLTGVVAILAALSKRDRTGVGGYVEIPMFESMVAFIAVEHLYGLHFEPPIGGPGYPRALTPERRPFPTTDGYICALPYNDRHWATLFEACSRPELATDPRFADMPARTKNAAELYRELANILATRSTAEWMSIFLALEIPCGPVMGLKELVDDPHLRATAFFTEIPQAEGGAIRFPGVPVLFDGERPPVRPPPELGEHTSEVLAGIRAGQAFKNNSRVSR